MQVQSHLLSPRYHLAKAAEALNVAYWTKDSYHTNEAFDHMIYAIIPEAHKDRGPARDWLKDVIATAITDSHDIDSTDEDAAQAVIDALLGHIAIRADEESEAA